MLTTTGFTQFEVIIPTLLLTGPGVRASQIPETFSCFGVQPSNMATMSDHSYSPGGMVLRHWGVFFNIWPWCCFLHLGRCLLACLPLPQLFECHCSMFYEDLESPEPVSLGSSAQLLVLGSWKFGALLIYFSQLSTCGPHHSPPFERGLHLGEEIFLSFPSLTPSFRHIAPPILSKDLWVKDGR